MDLKPQTDTDKTQIVSTGSRREPEYPLSDLTEKIIGAAMEVHRHLGVGFLEKVYENALQAELIARGVKATTQGNLTVAYKGVVVGSYVADLLVEDCIICEIKTAKDIVPEHEAQILNYLKATGIKLGLILNFGRARLQFRRFIN